MAALGTVVPSERVQIPLATLNSFFVNLFLDQKFNLIGSTINLQFVFHLSLGCL